MITLLVTAWPCSDGRRLGSVPTEEGTPVLRLTVLTQEQMDLVSLVNLSRRFLFSLLQHPEFVKAPAYQRTQGPSVSATSSVAR